MSQIDWSKAPELATHRCASTWYKNQDRIWFYWSETALEWHVTPYKSPENFTWWAANIPRPLAQEWTGEGLPPVGATCERRFPDIESSSWQGGIVLAHGSRKIFFRDNCGDEWAHSIDDVEFRPFRTPEQIAKAARSKACDAMYGIMISPPVREGNRSDMAEALYDAGYRKFEIVDN